MKQNCKQIKKLKTRRKERLSRRFWLPQKNTLPVKKKIFFSLSLLWSTMGATFKRIMKIRNKKSLRRWWVKLPLKIQLFWIQMRFRVKPGTKNRNGWIRSLLQLYGFSLSASGSYSTPWYCES